jgi:hypothetical protein
MQYVSILHVLQLHMPYKFHASFQILYSRRRSRAFEKSGAEDWRQWIANT